MRTRSSTNLKKKKVVQHHCKGSTKKHTKREKETSSGTLGSKCIDVETNKDKHYSLRRRTGKARQMIMRSKLFIIVRTRGNESR